MENNKRKLPKATISRLPLYLQFLQAINKDPKSYISATTISKEIGLGEILVRKDLQLISGSGKVRVGYKTSVLIRDIERALGIKHAIHAIIVGAGNLGMAFYGYQGFAEFGIKIDAAFDVDANKINTTSRKKVFPISQMKDYIAENKIKLAILTVPAFSSQYVCDKLVEAGIEAIWSFSPKKLVVPDHIIFKHEDLALSLAYLKNLMK